MLRDFDEAFLFPCVTNRQNKSKQNNVTNGCGHAIPCPFVVAKFCIIFVYVAHRICHVAMAAKLTNRIIYFFIL